MIPSKQQREEFEKLVRPLMQWVNQNCHPHVSVFVTTDHAELLEGVCSFATVEYVPD